MLDIHTYEDRCEVRLAGELTVYRAAELKPQLLDVLARHATTEINLAGVTELDSAGLQLLLLMKREALRQNQVLRLTAHSEASLEVIDALGLAGYFGDPLIVGERRGRA